MHAFKRRLAKYSRWLHIYVSMTSFVIVFFFAVTGWTLNHADRFSGAEQLRKTSGTVDTKWTGSGPLLESNCKACSPPEISNLYSWPLTFVAR